MFYNTNNILKTWDATGAMPAAVIDAMENLYYTNVTKKQTTSINSEQWNRIKGMLLAGKPLIMCGWGPNINEIQHSHYWVVDGVNNNSNSTITLLHCKWGWGGARNGWFSKSCLNQYEGVEYDGNYSAQNNSSSSSWTYLLTYTYDIPSSSYTFHISPALNYRAYYEEDE